VIATESEFAPFEFKILIDAKDSFVGADIELENAIADTFGVDVDFSLMSFNNVLASVTSGKADIAIARVSVTDERKKAYDFSDAYYEAENVVIIKKSDEATYTTLESLAGKAVGAQKGSIQENIAKDQLPDSSLVSLTSNGEMINELKNNQLQAVVLGKAIAEGYVLQNDDLMIADMTLESNDIDAYAVALPKEQAKI
jgi:polar amino acid transport system substrate-binding protein